MTETNESLSSLDSRLRKLEDVAAWIHEANDIPQDIAQQQIADIHTALLWLCKQPWEREFTSWADLIQAAKAGDQKPLKFRETVVT